MEKMESVTTEDTDSQYSEATTGLSTTDGDGGSEGGDVDEDVTLNINFKFTKSNPAANKDAVQQALKYCNSFRRLVEDSRSKESVFEPCYSMDSPSVLTMEDYLRTTSKLETELAQAKQELDTFKTLTESKNLELDRDLQLPEQQLRQEREYCYTLIVNLTKIAKSLDGAKLRWPSLVSNGIDGCRTRPDVLFKRYNSFNLLKWVTREHFTKDMKEIISYYSVNKEYDLFVASRKHSSSGKVSEHENGYWEECICSDCNPAGCAAAFVLTNILRLSSDIYEQFRLLEQKHPTFGDYVSRSCLDLIVKIMEDQHNTSP